MLSTPMKRKLTRFYWRYEPMVLGGAFAVILSAALIGVIAMRGAG